MATDIECDKSMPQFPFSQNNENLRKSIEYMWKWQIKTPSPDVFSHPLCVRFVFAVNVFLWKLERVDICWLRECFIRSATKWEHTGYEKDSQHLPCISDEKSSRQRVREMERTTVMLIVTNTSCEQCICIHATVVPLSGIGHLSSVPSLSHRT